MKKMLTITISMILTMTLLAGCGSTNEPTENAEETESSMQDEETTDIENTTGESNVNALVVYFTRAENIGGTPDVDATSSASININGSEATGNLKIMADYITQYTGADEFSILTVDAYPQGYRDTTDQAKTEQFLKELVQQIAEDKGFVVQLFEAGEGDHIHCFVSAPAKLSVTDIVKLV